MIRIYMKKDNFSKKRVGINYFTDDDFDKGYDHHEKTKNSRKKNRNRLRNLIQSGLDFDELDEVYDDWKDK